MKLRANVWVAIGVLIAAWPKIGEARLLSGFYDPDRERNSWTLTWTNSTSTLGYIEDGTWRVAVTCYSEAKHQLKLPDFCLNGATSSNTLDLSGVVKDSGQVTWTIVRCTQHAFQYQGSSLETIYMPREFINTDCQLFNGNRFTSLKTLVWDSPSCTVGLGQWCFSANMSKKLTQLYMNIPLCGTLADCDFTATLSETDVTDWRLDKLSNISDGTYNTFANRQFYGTLNLPALQVVRGSAFANSSKLGGLIIGTNVANAQISIATNACVGCTSLTNVILGGASSTYLLSTNCFPFSSAAQVTFNGQSPPAYASDSGIVFGTDATTSGSIVFHVPSSTSWIRYLRSHGLTLLTAAERGEYATAHPGERVPTGWVSPTAFHTAAAQYVKLSDRFFTVSQPVDQRYGEDRVEFTASEEPDANGAYPITTTFTLRAIPAATPTAGHFASHFCEWRGVPVGCRTNNPCTFALVDCKGDSAVAHFSHDWEFIPDDSANTESGAYGKISDGEWSIKVKSLGNRKLQIGVGHNTVAILTDDTTYGSLDLSGEVYLTGHPQDSGNQWTIKQLMQDVLADEYDTDTNIRELYAPKTLANLGSQSWRHMYALTNLVLDCPSAEGSFCAYALTGSNMKNFSRIVFALPKITSFGYSAVAWISGSFSDTDLNEWDLRSITSFDTCGTYFAGPGVSGTLSLPKIRSFGHSSLQTALGAVTNVILGDFGKQDIFMGSNTFNWCFNYWTDPTVTPRVEFRTKGNVTARDPLFHRAGRSDMPFEMVFYWRPPDATTLSMLTSNDNWKVTGDSKRLALIGSRFLGWSDIQGLDAPTDAERAALPSRYEKCNLLGIYRSYGVSAWVIHRDSIFDPKGTVLLIR